MQQKISVKFKIGTKSYSFLAEDINLSVGDYVVVETILGQAYGKVDKIEDYNPAKENRELKKVIRKATKEDEIQHEKMLERERTTINETKELANKYKLDMNVVNAEYSLDGSKVIIDFIAEDRVDFRDLVKELATKLKSRIELRQIGIRDQAKMVGGIGICGRVCCCSSYLKDFEKVSIKMAKSQGLALNPTKISGSCGRLMCCLAYEDNYYSEIYPKIPKLNKEVKTPDGVGVVVYTNALKQTASVKITSKDGSFTIKDYSLDDLSHVDSAQNSSLKDYKNFSNSQKNAEEQKINEKFDNKQTKSTEENIKEDKIENNVQTNNQNNLKNSNNREINNKETHNFSQNKNSQNSNKNSQNSVGQQNNKKHHYHNKHKNFKNKNANAGGGNTNKSN